MTELGAKRIGERGEGDDDKSMEEDYLAWKDLMWTDFAERMGVEEGGAGDVPDFVVKELHDHSPEKVYHGELSSRALLASASGTNTPVGAYGVKILILPLSSRPKSFSLLAATGTAFTSSLILLVLV